MNGRHCPRSRIDKQDRHAIGGSNAYRRSRLVRDKRVPIQTPVLQSARIADKCRMNLPQGSNRPERLAGLPCREAVIKPDEFLERRTAINALAGFAKQTRSGTHLHLAESDQLIRRGFSDLRHHHTLLELLQHFFVKTNVRWAAHQMGSIVDFLLKL